MNVKKNKQKKYIKKNKKKKKIGLLGKNQIFGEEDILSNTLRSFSIKCYSLQGEILMIKRDQFINKVMID